MRFIYTDGGNSDFIELCHCLDEFLNGLVGGEDLNCGFTDKSINMELL